MANLGKPGDRESMNLGHLIENATSQSYGNMAKFMQICDIINDSTDGHKEAIKAIRKRFATKNESAIQATLLLLRTCAKNCGMRFLVEIATRDFLHDFLGTINSKNNPSLEMETSVLGLLQDWAIAFKGRPELQQICKLYQDLRNTDVEFPPIESEPGISINIIPEDNQDDFPASRNEKKMNQLSAGTTLSVGDTDINKNRRSSKGNVPTLSAAGGDRRGDRGTSRLQPTLSASGGGGAGYLLSRRASGNVSTLCPAGSDKNRRPSAGHVPTLLPSGTNPRERSPSPDGLHSTLSPGGDYLKNRRASGNVSTLCPAGTDKNRRPSGVHVPTLLPGGTDFRRPSAISVTSDGEERRPSGGSLFGFKIDRRESSAPNSGDEGHRRPSGGGGGGLFSLKAHRRASALANSDDDSDRRPSGGNLFSFKAHRRTSAAPGLFSNKSHRRTSNEGDAQLSVTNGQTPLCTDSEVTTMREHCRAFVEMLSTVSPEKENSSDRDLLLEKMSVICRDMKKRIIPLLKASDDEEVSAELLSVNDELSDALRLYEKYRSSGKKGHGGTAAKAGDSKISNLDDSRRAALSDNSNQMDYKNAIQIKISDTNDSSMSYSPDNAKMVVDSEQDLAEMEKWVKENEGRFKSNLNSDLEKF